MACGTGRKAGTASPSLAARARSIETRRGLPGEPEDAHSRYLEAAIGGLLIGGLYLPNGNPRPGPKFDYKLRWFERLIAHARGLLDSGLPVLLMGDFNVMPTERDVYKPERWLDDALFAPETRAAVPPGRARLDRRLARGPRRRDDLYLLGLFPERLCAQRRASGSTISCSAPTSPSGWSTPKSTAKCAGGRKPATTRRSGSSWPTRPRKCRPARRIWRARPAARP